MTSETGVLTSTARETFGMGLQKSPATSQPVIQNMRLAFSTDGAAVYKPTATATATASPSYQSSPYSAAGGSGMEASPHGINVNMGSGGETMKKKRGRPRKYGPDGSIALGLAPALQSVPVTQPSGVGFSAPPAPVPAPAPVPVPAPAPPSVPAVNSIPAGGSSSPAGIKKARGRPPGPSKKQQLEALGPAGFGFIPHVITVNAGEDISSKIMSFSQHGPRAICILSASGSVSNVTLRQPAISGGTITYEGIFEILSLSGSFLPSENGGQRSRTGGLSLSLSGPDGRVLGGGVAGLLTAASAVQVVVASFISDGRKESKSANQVQPLSAIQVEPLSAVSRLTSAGGATGTNSPPSRGTLSESSGGPGSPLNQNTGACNNSHTQGISSMSWK